MSGTVNGPVAAPVRVLVDAVSARVGGGGTFATAQLEALAALPELDLTIYATGLIAERLQAACPGAKVHRCADRNVVRRLVWEQLVLAWRARDHDVVYTTGNFALFASPRPQALALQNAWYFTDLVRAFRRRCPWRRRARLAAEAGLARASIRRSDRAIAVSESMRAAVEQDLGRLDHLTVVPSAAPVIAAVDPDASGLPAELEYALVVAHDDPHKEWDGLVETFAADPGLPGLVIVGACRPARQAQLERRIAAAGALGRIHLLGRVDDPGRLAALYRGARLFVAHSHFESYGLTAREALAAGTRVIATDIPAHREVCGDRAVYYPVGDWSALAESVRQAALEDPPGVPEDEAVWTWSHNARELGAILTRLVRTAEEAPA